MTARRRTRSRSPASESTNRPQQVLAEVIDGVSRKIQDYHRQRLAIVYVRQSTPHQVNEHRESGELQYGLARIAERYGWSKDRILIIDEDQGHSGRTADGRLGFQRLIAEVGLDHVGLVLGIEMSRLARSNKDWHQLIELCAVFHTVLADQDGIYDPTDYNDRLLLGLRGMMSEAELHILRGRMYQGMLNKARRGELFNHVPLGYVLTPAGKVAFEPDKEVQNVVKLVFAKFEELGSALSLLRYLHRQQIRLPIRPIFGPNKGQLEWRKPTYSTIINMLHNPTYAGSYAHGRFQIDPRRRTTKKDQGRYRATIDEWKVLIHGKLPAYITWEQYVANIDRLYANGSQWDSAGAAREGEALLAGIVVCGRCGKRMSPRYKGKTKLTAYVCLGDQKAESTPACQRVTAQTVDELIAQQVLAAIEPASLQLSLHATGEIQRERDRVHAEWKRRLGKAAGEVERLRHQYDAVDPANRLVATELEHRWEEALRQQRCLKEDYDRFLRDQPDSLGQKELLAVEQLATNIPRLWNTSPQASADRKEIVRHLIERVTITTEGNSEVVEIMVRWHGGVEHRHEVIRSVAKYEQLRDFERLRSHVTELWRSGRSTTAIARALNAEGFRTTLAGRNYTRHTVRELLDSWGLTEPKRPQASAEQSTLGSNEWWLLDLSRRLSIDHSTLSRWCRRGWVHARYFPGQRRWWIAWADQDECDRLRRLYEHGRGCPHDGSPYPVELKTPKHKPPSE
ncbi:MAG TPA: recombinase family protein [Pirellulales bacterium]|nr:recombinase family protein [Pirellulales bacterium]